MRFLPRLVVVLLCCLPVMGQNIRWDQLASTTTGSGQLVPVLAIPGATVNFYTGCTVLPCGTKATTYNAPTGSTACASSQQVVWQLPLPQACTSTADSQGNFGGYFQPGPYQYTVSIGSVTSGPYQFNVGGGGGSSGGVTSINAVAGAFIFNGTGVSCTTTTCTFSNTASGVNPGTIDQISYYSDANHVSGDASLTDTAPANATTGVLSYTGGLGSSFSTLDGGLYSFTTKDTTTSPVSGPASQINLVTDLEALATNQNNSGNINLLTTENAGNSNAGNINIEANATTSSNNGGVGNVSILAQSQSTTGTNSGIINITAVGLGPASNTGFINLVATNAVTINAPNFGVNNLGQMTANGTIETAAFFNSAVLSPGNCLQADSSGDIVSAGAPCGSGGGGSGITGLTAGFVPLAGSSTTLTANSHLDEVSNAGFDTFSQGVIVGDSSGVGGSFTSTEGTAPSAGSNIDTLYGDSATHRLKQNPNNSGATILSGIASAGAAGAPVKLAANGIDIADATPGTPTHTADAGAGTGGSLVVSFATGANDNAGYVNLTTGGSPSASSGVITINYGGTYAAARKCVVTPSSALAQALGANGLFVPASTSTVLKFDITVGTTALPANTTGYQWSWSCQN